ncbi:hypothetical protein [Calorimonas adulescens]|uniref:Type I-B CRISPR-associated protein Cas8b1/Cst1 n=1 Tax=Calorimonas adulescens TaxID=2606906 RepID=A0A5D8QAR7_9THEO|nr:hypothetical protein [Calorimonas adulescens]TZE81611.1 hypothetical protein FWJ32_08840 [Calorimonas adulescens]
MNIVISTRNDVWLNNALTNFYRMVNDIQKNYSSICTGRIFPDRVEIEVHDEDKFVELFMQKIFDDRDRYIFVEREKNGVSSNTRKDYICLQYGSKVEGRNVLKESTYSPADSNTVIKNFLDQYRVINGKRKKERCILCGEEYVKPRNSDGLKQAVYPLSTRNKAMSNIRTDFYKENGSMPREYFKNVCPTCYIMGVLEWCDPAHVFLTRFDKGSSYLLIPEVARLDELYDFKEFYSKTLYVDNLVSSLKIKVNRNGEERDEYAYGGYSLLLAFLEEAYSQYYMFEDRPDTLYFNDWLMMEIPSGNMRDVRPTEIDIDREILDVIYGCVDKNVYAFKGVIDNIRVIKGDGSFDFSVEPEVKEQMSYCFLRDDFDGFAHAVSPSGSSNVIFLGKDYNNLTNFIKLWRWEKLKLSDDDYKTTQQVAAIIARVAEQHSNLLFRLDRVRSISDLLDLLREVGRRFIFLEEKDRRYLSPGALDRVVEILSKREIDGSEFDDFKNTLAILSYAYVGRNMKFVDSKEEVSVND